MTNPARETLFLRVIPELKRAVRELATELGVTDNVAGAMLIREALDARQRRRRRG